MLQGEEQAMQRSTDGRGQHVGATAGCTGPENSEHEKEMVPPRSQGADSQGLLGHYEDFRC